MACAYSSLVIIIRILYFYRVTPSVVLLMDNFVFVISSRHNWLGKPVRPAADSTEQMATPALFHSKHKLLSRRDGERMVTQESHPGG